jgi:hypothetical protein
MVGNPISAVNAEAIHGLMRVAKELRFTRGIRRRCGYKEFPLTDELFVSWVLGKKDKPNAHSPAATWKYDNGHFEIICQAILLTFEERKFIWAF